MPVKPHITKFRGKWITSPNPMHENVDAKLIQKFEWAGYYVTRLNRLEKK